MKESAEAVSECAKALLAIAEEIRRKKKVKDPKRVQQK